MRWLYYSGGPNLPLYGVYYIMIQFNTFHDPHTIRYYIIINNITYYMYYNMFVCGCRESCAKRFARLIVVVVVILSSTCQTTSHGFVIMFLKNNNNNSGCTYYYCCACTFVHVIRLKMRARYCNKNAGRRKYIVVKNSLAHSHTRS